MYHNIMDLYGDKGNIMVLRQRCIARDIDIIIDTCDINEEKDLSLYDICFIGGGADREQQILCEDLLMRKDNIKKALDNKTFFFLICGGYQLFGTYYMNAENEKVNGLGICDYYTEASNDKKRCIGNIIVHAILEGNTMELLGFENHNGQTYNVSKPLGEVIIGNGNHHHSQIEGYYDGRILGTYMHGPLLPKNPELADFIIYKGLQKHNSSIQYKDLAPLNDELEHKAKKVLINRFTSLK